MIFICSAIDGVFGDQSRRFALKSQLSHSFQGPKQFPQPSLPHRVSMNMKWSGGSPDHLEGDMGEGEK